MSKPEKFNRVGWRPQHATLLPSHEVVDLNQTYCPRCNAGPMDGATGVEVKDDDPAGDDEKEESDGFPKDGSPTICSYCGELLMFHTVSGSGALTLTLPTEAEIDELKSNFQAWQMISMLKERIEQEAEEGRLRGEKRYANSKPKRF